jgi:hypothetical protein
MSGVAARVRARARRGAEPARRCRWRAAASTRVRAERPPRAADRRHDLGADVLMIAPEGFDYSLVRGSSRRARGPMSRLLWISLLAAASPWWRGARVASASLLRYVNPFLLAFACWWRRA